MRDAKPTASHRALAQLEEAKKLGAIITQNIDNLHQMSGSRNVIDFHGTTATVSCMKCKKQFSRKIIEKMSIPLVARNVRDLLNLIFFFSERRYLKI
jgi:NAD-dependent deacetylase